MSTLPLIEYLNTLPPELISMAMYLFCGAAILILLRAFGLPGLFLFISMAIVAANISVLKAVQFSFLESPVAIGTVVFASTYLCSDIITEFYGKHAAKLSVWLSFAGMIMIAGTMTLAMGYSPLKSSAIEHQCFIEAHGAILTLFSPSVAIFAASLIAYLVSQYNDIWIYNMLHKINGNRLIWLRSILSTSISALIDNTIFSILAWQVFSPKPMDFHTVLYTYILGTLWIRILMAFMNTPFIYAAKKLLPRKRHYESIH